MIASSKTDQTIASDYPSRKYGWYVVTLLILAYILSFIDRGILALMIGPIKASLQLTDVEISWLMGPAFGLFYVTLGIPIAVLADKYSRRNIIMAGVFVWSLATAACGLAWSYMSLFIARMTVGAGEATLTPGAYSIIPDYFPRKEAIRAVGLYTSGQSIGSGLAFLLGGQIIIILQGSENTNWPIIGQLEPWQMVFVILGVTGILFSLLMLTVKEPKRRGVTRVNQDAQPVPLVDAVKFMKQRWRSFLALFVGNSVVTTIGYSYFWFPTMVERSWDMTAAEAGTWYGLIMAIAGPCGVYFGSWAAEKLYARGRSDAPYFALTVALMCTMPFAILLPLSSGPIMALVLVAPVMFGLAMGSATSSAALVHVAPAEFRAQVSAVYLLVISLIGMFLGPPFVAMLTDLLFQDESKIRYSLLIVTLAIGPIGLSALWLGRRYYLAAAHEADSWHKESSEQIG